MAHINTGIRRANTFGFLHQNISAFNRVNAVAPGRRAHRVIRRGVVCFQWIGVGRVVARWVGTGHFNFIAKVGRGNRALFGQFATTTPDGTHLFQSTVVHAFHFERIAGRIANRQVTHGNTAHIRGQKTFLRGAVAKRQESFIHAAAFNNHILGGCNLYAGFQIKKAAIKPQNVFGFELHHGLDHFLRGIGPGLNQENPAIGLGWIDHRTTASGACWVVAAGGKTSRKYQG